MKERYNISVSGNAPIGMPADIAYLQLRNDDQEEIFATRKFPFRGPWGIEGRSDINLTENIQVPLFIDTVYLSVSEQKFYIIDQMLDSNIINECINDYRRFNAENSLQFIVGFAPFGKIALWLYFPCKQYLIGWLEGKEITVDMEDFFPNNPDIQLSTICEHYIRENRDTNNLSDINGIPQKGYFDALMRQYTYRYVLNLQQLHENQAQDEIKIVNIKDNLFDGTFDCRNNGDLLLYHKGAIIHKLAVELTTGKHHYTICFIFNKNSIQQIFEDLCDNKIDIIITAYLSKHKYELALYRQGMKEPVIIPESAYQLIVFKNKFEDYRSANYNQPRGAWIW